MQKPLTSRNNSPLVELSQKNSNKSRINEGNKKPFAVIFIFTFQNTHVLSLVLDLDPLVIGEGDYTTDYLHPLLPVRVREVVNYARVTETVSHLVNPTVKSPRRQVRRSYDRSPDR